MKDVILESALVSEMARHVPSGSVLEEPCDVALVDVDPAGESFLAVTADAVCEEVMSGLFEDPYTIGWLVIMASASDLAAAGARPIGIAVTLGIPAHFGHEARTALGRGIGDACRSLGTTCLRSDTNLDNELRASACALGLVAKDRVLTRRGARPGDALYLSGRAGLGNAYALSRFVPEQGAECFPFLPRARLKMGQVMAGLASCSMDTSDGVLATLDELAKVNDVGFAITADPASFLHPHALSACDCRRIPRWLALAGCQGEYELVFTVRPAIEERLRAAGRRTHLAARCIGHVTEEPGVFLSWGGRDVKVNSGWIRNLSVEGVHDARRYISDLVAYAQSLPV